MKIRFRCTEVLVGIFLPFVALAQDSSVTQEQIESWIRALGDDTPEAREKAQAHLIRAGEAALPLLKKHEKDEDAEIAARIRQILGEILKPEVFKAARRLAEAPSEDGWRQVLGLVSALQARLEKDVGGAPYPATASPWNLSKSVNAQPGQHTIVRDVRYADRQAPSGYIFNSAVVVDGDFENKEGYVNGSVVIVTGNMTVNSYIKDCIVLVGGKLKVGQGYVNDSLVVAMDSMEIDGYAWGALLGGIVRINAYVKDSVILGRLEQRSEDLRGAKTRDEAILRKALEEVRKPEFVLSEKDKEQKRKEEADLKQRRLSRPVKVGLVQIELESPASAKKLLETVGAEVAGIDPETSAEGLSKFEVVYFADGWGRLTGLGDLSASYRKYVKEGGAILFARPDAGGNVENAPALKLLPYPVKLSNAGGIGDNPVRMYTPDKPHPLAKGLTANDLPFPFGYIEESDPAWTLLAQGHASKKASLAAAEFGKGRVVLHMTLDTAGALYCSEKFLTAALEWLARIR